MPVKIKDVYVIPKGGDPKQVVGAPIGVAFVCEDGSLNVKLDAVPVAGLLHIRDRLHHVNQKNNNKPKNGT